MKIFTIIINLANAIVFVYLIATDINSGDLWMPLLLLFLPIWNIIYLFLPPPEIQKLEKEIKIKELKKKLTEISE